MSLSDAKGWRTSSMSHVFNIDHSLGVDYVPWILLAAAILIALAEGAENLARKQSRITD